MIQVQLLARQTSDGPVRERIESAIAAADRIHEIVGRMNRVVRLAFLDQSRNLPEMLDLWRASDAPEDTQER